MREVVEKKANGLASRIDRAIGFFAPGWAFQRLQYRKATESLSAYRGGGKNRLRAHWVTSAGSADEDLLLTLSEMRETSRDLNRNDGQAAGITETMVSHVVGQGIKTQSSIDGARIGLTREETRALERDAEYVFGQWMQECDAAGQGDWYEMQDLWFRQILEAGEAIAIRKYEVKRGRLFRFRWQTIEPDRLFDPFYGANKRVRGGVEIDADGEAVAYYIRRTHPGDYRTGESGDLSYDRIPAFDEDGRPNVLHLYRRKRPGQSRGIPFFAPVISYFQDMADYLEAEVVAARVAACFSLFVVSKTPATKQAAASVRTQSNGRRVEELEPGMIEYLGPGEEIQSFNPNRPASNFDPFLVRMLRLISMSLNLPYEVVSKDFSQTNYSSARAALLEAWQFFKQWQRWLSRRALQVSYELALEDGFLLGLWNPRDFYQYRRVYTGARHVPPAGRWVDPLKEVQAAEQAIAANLSTLAEECASQARDWEEVMEQRAREREYMSELGLDVVGDMQVPPPVDVVADENDEEVPA